MDYSQTSDAARKQAIDEKSNAIAPVMAIYKEIAQALTDIFEKVVPGDRASWLERYAKAVRTVMPDGKRKIEELMKEILEKLQLPFIHHYFEAAVSSVSLGTAIEELSEISPPLPDDTLQYAHNVAGSLNMNTTSRTMNTYTYSGGSGKMFISAGGPMNFTQGTAGGLRSARSPGAQREVGCLLIHFSTHFE